MERINYSKLIQQILKGHLANDLDDTEVQFICDTKEHHYLIINLGWKEAEYQRVYGCVIHVDIKDNKIWIQRDFTEVGVANELLAAGVPKQDIVLGFQAPCSLSLPLSKMGDVEDAIAPLSYSSR